MRCAQSSARASAAACLPPASAAERKFWRYAGKYRCAILRLCQLLDVLHADNRMQRCCTKSACVRSAFKGQGSLHTCIAGCGFVKGQGGILQDVSLAASVLVLQRCLTRKGCDGCLLMCRKKRKSRGCRSQRSAGNALEVCTNVMC